MNRIYRLVWNRNRHVWMAVAENSRGRSKSGLSRKLLAGVLALVGGALLAPLAIAAPVGGQVSAGIGSIAQAGANTTITQSSQNLAINWQGFGIAANEAVRFNQPNASAIALNRVLGQDPSRILGSLSANGQVFVLNPNGVLFGATAQVNVGGLVASTLSISDADFMAGKHSFGNGGAAGSVLNQGTLTAASGGYIALLAPDVRNEGVISATLGSALLAAGDKVTLTLNNGSLLAYRIDQGSLNALAENKQLIQADGGQVFMSAKAANALSTAMVNNTGIIEARTVQNVAGVIKLTGDMQVGQVNVGGTLDASAPNGGNGGFIETSASRVRVADDAKVTTAAPQGNAGTWLIDPTNFTIAAGSGALTTSGIGATTLSNNLGSTSVIIATAVAGAEAGDIFVNSAVTWAINKLTLSAHNNININANLNASGAASLALEYGQGAVALNNTSNYILAPNVQVNLPAGPNFSTKLGSNGAVKAYTVITSPGAMGSTTTTDLQGMNGNRALNYALGSNIDATATSGWNGGAGFTQVGYWNANFTGTFDGLGHSITGLTINSGFQGTGFFGYVGNGGTVKNVGLVGGSITGVTYVGALVGYNNGGMVSNSYATGTVTGNSVVGGLVGENYGSISNSYATGTVTGGGYVGGLVGVTSSISGISNSYATGAVTGASNVGGLVGYAHDLGTVRNSHYNIDTVMINGVTSRVTPYGIYNAQYLDWLNNNKVLNIASYASTLPLNNGYYQISTTQGLKDLLGFADNASYKFRLTTNLDLAAIPGWHIPYFAGLEFDGAGYALDNLAVNQPMNNRIGFIGMLASGSQLGNLGLTNVNVTGADSVGGLVGEHNGTISNSYTTGAVTGLWDYSGGLVGISYLGAISNSYSAVNMTGNIYVGGLVGLAYGDISNSYATGTVTGGTFGVGGLVGEHDGGIISNSYATGTVMGADYGVGGLVGAMYGGAISNSYAIGGVSGTYSVGGLVGNNSGGSVSNSYAIGDVSGGGGVGGLVGEHDGGIISNSYATGRVTGVGVGEPDVSDSLGGLVGINNGEISNSYATGSVSGTNNIGGLVGINNGDISNSYATGSVSGTINIGGLIGDNSIGFLGDNSFWDSTVNAVGIGSDATIGDTSGATGMSTAQMMSMSTFSSAGWSISNTGGSGAVWRIYEGNTTPWLMWWLKPVTVTLNSDTQTYSGASYSGGNGYAVGNPAPSLSGTVGSPNPALSGTLAYGGNSQLAVNAGSYTLGASGLHSIQQGYDISYVNSTLTINKANLTVTADNKSRLYGAANPALTSTVSGFVNGETANNAAGYSGAANITTLANATTNVGTALITGATGNLAATNYDFAAANGTLTINPAEIITPPVGGILPAVVDAIIALPGGADLLPAFSSTVTVAATQIDAVAPPPALANLQYVYVTTTPGNLSGDIDTTVDGKAAPTKAQGSKSDGFNERLPDVPIQFTGTVLVRNGGINLPSGADDSNERDKERGNK